MKRAAGDAGYENDRSDTTWALRSRQLDPGDHTRPEAVTLHVHKAPRSDEKSFSYERQVRPA